MLVDSPLRKEGKLEMGEERGSTDLGVRAARGCGCRVRFESGQWVCLFGRSGRVLLSLPKTSRIGFDVAWEGRGVEGVYGGMDLTSNCPVSRHFE